MRAIAAFLKGIGGLSLLMTGFHLWTVGFPRLEGPEGKTWGGVLVILASYAVMGLMSWGIFAGGQYLGKRALRKDQE